MSSIIACMMHGKAYGHVSKLSTCYPAWLCVLTLRPDEIPTLPTSHHRRTTQIFDRDQSDDASQTSLRGLLRFVWAQYNLFPAAGASVVGLFSCAKDWGR